MKISSAAKLLCAAVFVAFFCADALGQVTTRETMRIKQEAEIKYKVQLDAPETAQHCQATVSLEYFQRNTLASVEGTLVNSDCAASGGEFTVAIRIRDEAGEIKELENLETWERDDDQPVMFDKDYPIGENVDLLRVRAKRVRCVCAETPEEGLEAEEEPPE